MAEQSVLQFKTMLGNLLKARFPCLYISTWEEERALQVIDKVVHDTELIRTTRKLFTWNLTDGIKGEGQSGKEETKTPLKALEFIEKYTEPAVFVLKDFHIFFGGQGRLPDFQVIRKIRNIIPALKLSTPKNIIFLSPTLILPKDLEKDVTVIDFELPSFLEIERLLDDMIDANRDNERITIELSDEEKERLAKAALGLTLQEAENAFARAMVENGRLCIKDMDIILEEKRQIIKKSEILEFIKSDLNMDDVGGLENLKRWLKKRDKSWLDSAQRYGLPAPKGVLITGVPGCGKSLIAKAVGATWQLPLLRLDIGKIYSGIVGSSEENMRRAIQTAEAIAPSILWIDEIEKGLSGMNSNGDSGTSTRIFGTFLTWMQEKKKPVFVVATANNIQSLPPELLRKGRFDEIFFVDLPTLRERMAIFEVHLKKRLHDEEVKGSFHLTEAVMERLAQKTESFVGAEIEQIVVAALFEAYSENRAIEEKDLYKAIDTMIPLAVTQAETIRAIREWANVRAVAATSQDYRVEYQQPSFPEKEEKSPAPAEDIRALRGGRTIDF
ncbi:AAA family ATPase [Heliorestis acidaminivorans]|uniref:Uncharacterized AAA domain-containing protein ycf46 n=1 Tax=Heliorestis acidaminivorans TaxID=553427 RepID=A0A6I0EZ57_9FIRM|nr:AAA family ATPase [Heliorestis acidaminivorans]KAB2952682.1 AAA family ATPase [Heliorestis acidaminivorans]